MYTPYNEAEYLELSIKCLFRDRNALQKALDLHMRPEDFGTINIYRAFVDTALRLKNAPINPQLCLLEMKNVFPKYNLRAEDKENIINFWEYVYTEEPLNSEYIISHMAEFLKFRRYQDLKVNETHSPEELVNQAGRLVSEIELKDKSEHISVIKPFEELSIVDHQECFGTGFNSVDMVAKGLALQEFGLILGHSGSGKTAMAVFSAIQNAKRRKKVLYLSLEEPAKNIANRLYSNVFRLPYTDLHRGNVLTQDDLRNAFNNMCERDKSVLKNLEIHDLRAASPLTPRYIANYLDQLYEKTGYHPDVIYIDQLDYLEPNDTADQEARWQKYERAAFHVKDLCDHLIGGEHKFAVWLLHQAGGKMARRFTNAEVASCKGIIKPTDMVLAIGRDTPADSVVSIFSIKSRHGKNFQFDYFAELEFMNFEEHDGAAAERTQVAEREKPSVQSGYRNIPSRPTLLPQPGRGTF